MFSLFQKIFSAVFLLFIAFLFISALGVKTQHSFSDTEITEKKIFLADNNFLFSTITKENSVEEFLKSQKLVLGENDEVFPSPETKIYSGSHIIIKRAVKVIVLADGEEKIFYTHKKNVAEALNEQNLNLKNEDIVIPSRESGIYSEMKIKITRVEIKSETIVKSIAYKTITQEDKELGWREKKTKQKGKNGSKEIEYKVVYHNNKEISREIKGEKILKEPIDEIIVQGTYVKLGKSHTGQASWYNYTGTMSAANPWLPLGSFVKVTNRANGKSVIVRINDRGPFGKGRIIDLDKVAFQKLASLGAGVIDVKMEEILN